MAWEENSRICLHMQLIAILSRIVVAFALTGRQANAHKPRALPWTKSFCPFRACWFCELLPFQGVLVL